MFLFSTLWQVYISPLEFLYFSGNQFYYLYRPISKIYLVKSRGKTRIVLWDTDLHALTFSDFFYLQSRIFIACIMINQAFVCDTSLLSLPLSSCKWTSTENQTKHNFHCLEAKTTLQKVGLSQEDRWCLSRSMVHG